MKSGKNFKRFLSFFLSLKNFIGLFNFIYSFFNLSFYLLNPIILLLILYKKYNK